MTVAWELAKRAAIVALFSTVFLLLPAASSHGTFTLPTIIYAPIAAVLKLDAVFPFGVLLLCATLTVARQGAMLLVWVWSFVAKLVFR